MNSMYAPWLKFNYYHCITLHKIVVQNKITMMFYYREQKIDCHNIYEEIS